MGYKEFEIDTIGYNGEVNPFTFNLTNISYYRPFIQSTKEMNDNPRLQTMVYLVGSVKAIHVNCSYADFKANIKEIQEN
jgi:hypothetical protein|tara:strand:+ start:625 stop:861 length:237 start_codon:yes stop_codon:yes gene_type:complete